MGTARRTVIGLVAALTMMTTLAVLPALGDTSTTYTFSGQVSATGGHRSAGQTLQLFGAAGLALTLVWSNGSAGLELALKDPNGRRWPSPRPGSVPRR